MNSKHVAIHVVEIFVAQHGTPNMNRRKTEDRKGKQDRLLEMEELNGVGRQPTRTSKQASHARQFMPLTARLTSPFAGRGVAGAKKNT